MKKVLLIEESREFRAVLRSALSASYEVLEAEGVRDALSLAIQSGPDLVIVDESLEEVCTRLRVHPATRGIPIIMVADSVDHGEWSARVRCLERGADDAVHRAFYPEELLAKVRARLREREREEREQQALVAGNLVLDPGGASVRIEDRPVVLTPTEFELLRYFLERKGRVIPRKQLLGELWPETVVTRRTIDTHIANLRRKLRGFDHSFETIYGAGYRLCIAEGWGTAS